MQDTYNLISKIKNSNWYNIVILSILFNKYLEYISNIKIDKSSDFKRILKSFNINNKYSYELFLPIFIKSLNKTFLSVFYKDNYFYIDINDYENKLNIIPNFIIINENNNKLEYIPSIKLTCKIYNFVENSENNIIYNSNTYKLYSCIIENQNEQYVYLLNGDKKYIYHKNKIEEKEWKISSNDKKTLIYIKITNNKNSDDYDKIDTHKLLLNYKKDILSNIDKIKNKIKESISKEEIKELNETLLYLKNKFTEKELVLPNLTKTDYIKLIKIKYPHYGYLNTYSKNQLKNIYNKICSNNLNLKYNNNSCYMDSLLVTLFNSKNENIEKILLNASLNIYNSVLNNIGKEIQQELNKIYNTIHINNKINECKNLRKLFHNYSINYKKYIKSSNSLNSSNDINWLTEQNDYSDILTFLRIIFNIPDILKYKINGNIQYGYFVYLFPLDDLLNNEIIYINKFFPKYKKIIKLDSDNYYYDENKLITEFKEEIEILSTPFLFIHFNKIFDDTKLEKIIIPTLKLKLKENNRYLYLNSIIVHYGTAKGGHYITLFECNNIWYEYDDMKSNLKLIGTFENILEKDNYIKNISGLFYI